MCILFIAVNQHQDYPLIIAANRDEFHARETQFGHWWQTTPPVLAGKDCVAGGSWMGITQEGKIAALTNIRDPGKINDNAASRGELVVNYLTGDESDQTYLDGLKHSREDYNGYNLLFGHWNKLQVYNNHLDKTVDLTSGVYGLSNAELNSPWPKTTKGMKALAEYCHAPHPIEEDALFAILHDDIKAEDKDLPQTGVPYHWEKLLSSTFIITPDYGTRTSTLLLIDIAGQVTWKERYFDAQGTQIHRDNFGFSLKG